MRRRVLINLFSLLLLCHASAHALTPEEFADVRKQFIGGVRSEEANAALYDRLQKLLEQDRDNPLLLAYLGSTETLMGKHAWMPWKKLDYVNDGIAHMERALSLAQQQGEHSPHLPEVQLVAASTYVRLPDMFNTFDKGKKLLAKLLQAQSNSQWPDGFHHSLYSAAADAAERDGDKEGEKKWQALADALAANSGRQVKQP